MRGRSILCLFALAAWICLACAGTALAQPNPAAQAARRWRASHERAILGEYLDFLRLPDVSRDSVNVRRNADHVLAMMTRRGIHARLLQQPGAAPVVYGEILAPGARRTYVFYAHYDGQPVTPAEWASPPFD